MKVHRGKEVQFNVFIMNTLHWGEKVGFTPRQFLFRGKSAQYPMNAKLGEPQSQPGRTVDEIILKLLFEFEPRFLGCPVGSVYSIPIYRCEQKAPCKADCYVYIHGPW
jgi:hypothetical protein